MVTHTAQDSAPLVVPEPPRPGRSRKEETTSFLWAGAFVVLFAGCILTQLLSH